MVITHFIPVDTQSEERRSPAASVVDGVARAASKDTAGGIQTADKTVGPDAEKAASAENIAPVGVEESEREPGSSLVVNMEWAPTANSDVDPVERILNMFERMEADKRLAELGLSEEEIASGKASLGFRYVGPEPPSENESSVEGEKDGDFNAEGESAAPLKLNERTENESLDSGE